MPRFGEDSSVALKPYFQANKGIDLEKPLKLYIFSVKLSAASHFFSAHSHFPIIGSQHLGSLSSILCRTRFGVSLSPLAPQFI